ncbi:flagellar biosynthesis protein FliQ [Temperatibacter marinus]|uniref:Flagellar biosynthetic protein FliQ n=1 Tax=Temperatibacter marinus TaxID=1456591 RepID=A0AA52EC99_9PROT|nr:flagellar biosynthesis protein FliQ [Temperatibacter marinus]WND02146.1 flagellar biosynthesis protein FliQ [Temperatibacter marinus]
MTGAEVIEVGRDAILTLLAVATPIVGAGLGIGLTIALFQSVTQIQEMTLTFVPKIVTIFLVLLFSLPYIGRQMADLFQRIMDRIVLG